MSAARTLIFIPPVAKPTGGVAVLLQIAAHLHALGRPVWLAHREPPAWSPEGLAGDLPSLDWGALALTDQDVWLVPEGWVNALAPGLAAGARCVVYVQNWAYLLSALPAGMDWRSLPVRFLAVSDPVALYVREIAGAEAPILYPAIDRAVFRRPAAKPEGPLRIAWMPRKNKAVAERVRDAFMARNGRGGVEWLAVEGLPASGVAELLASAHIFLATGFPEGCPLPPLEAMACGCLVAGFGGYGGHDYMRQAGDFPGAYQPWWPLRPVAWKGNGLWTADADVLAAVLALEQAADWWAKGDPRLARTLAAAELTVHHFTPERQRMRVAEFWDGLAE